MYSTKRCHRCLTLKALDEFHRFAASRDGRQPVCKACRRESRGSGGPDKTHADPVTRFWRQVDRSGDCWVWTGHTQGFGYGRFRAGGKGSVAFQAHRFSWELHHGPIPPGLFVCHRCDNPPCVKPDHLFLGTHTDNMRDAYAKRRRWVKLTEAQLQEIESLLQLKQLSMRAIGRRFGMSHSVISRIARGKHRLQQRS